MNRQIRQLALGLMALYVMLFGALNFWQVGQEEELNGNVENTRAIRREFNKPRGPIVTADGVVVARSVPNPDPETNERIERLREYPTGDLFAHLTGYFTLAFGSTQVERTHGDVLTGSTTEQQIRSLGDLLDNEIDNSGSVQLTLRHDLQQLAQQLLGERTGSVVVTEVATGAVRAMYSNPTFDPAVFANAPFEEAQDAIVALQEAEGDPLLSGAYQQRFMPGSTFKVITTGIGLESGIFDLDSDFARETEWVPPQTTDPIQNYRGSQCGGDLAEVFRRSCNIPFAQMSVFLGPDAMVAGTEAWGMEAEVPLDLPRAASSTFGDTSDLDQRLPLLASKPIRLVWGMQDWCFTPQQCLRRFESYWP
ncbi:MAG: penicillin-binding transpeptidase domain-containing protein, partial [Actinomycetota bacterium]